MEASLSLSLGGKILPDELTQEPMEGNLPLKLLTTAHPKYMVGRNSARSEEPPKDPIVAELEATLKKIYSEVDEKKEFLGRMESADPKKAKQYAPIIAREIAASQKEIEEVKRLLAQHQGK